MKYMKKIELACWEDYKNIISNDIYDRAHGPLYRGQANSAWRLETTLDRIQPSYNIKKYYQRLNKINDDLNSCYGIKHDLSEFEVNKEFHSKYNLKTCAFMAYVRHLGFQSPLLDWTRSPYIAAYFAFQELINNTTHIAIYKYTENSYGTSTRDNIMEPYIYFLSSHIFTHKRHYLQQSQYTTCKAGCETDPIFGLHEKANLDGKSQSIVKYILPVSERKNILTELLKMNIHSFSLFATEESLVHSMAVQEFVIAHRQIKGSSS